jgi:hypothetical protein
MKILICGGGALGSHVLLLGRDLGADLAVVDDDRVETKNLASQWFVKQMVGKNKASALKTQMQNFHGVKVRDFAVRLTDLNIETLLGPVDLVVDCFDNADSRQLVQDWVRANDKACLHGGLAADGGFGVVRWDESFTIDSEDVPGQATCEGAGFLPLINMVSATLVRSIRDWMEDGSRRNWNISPTQAESF